MLIESLLTLISNFFQYIFGLLPNVPQLSSSITDVIDNFLDLIFDNAGIIGFFLPLDLIKILVPLIILVIHFEDIYKLILWIIRKIPFFNMQ